MLLLYCNAFESWVISGVFLFKLKWHYILGLCETILLCQGKNIKNSCYCSKNCFATI